MRTKETKNYPHIQNGTEFNIWQWFQPKIYFQLIHIRIIRICRREYRIFYFSSWWKPIWKSFSVPILRTSAMKHRLHLIIFDRFHCFCIQRNHASFSSIHHIIIRSHVRNPFHSETISSSMVLHFMFTVHLSVCSKYVLHVLKLVGS